MVRPVCRILALGLFGALPLFVFADQPSTDSLEPQKSFELPQWLQWFGYLNVGYGVADDHKHRGVPVGGTLDLHTVALQLRASLSSNNQFVVQLANERVGTSPSNQFREDLEVDWLYFQHSFGNDNTSLRIGRIPLPVGIYNEIKDVGILLPFYRPSGVFYGDGTWTSDSVDGIMLSHSFALGSWTVDSDLYYGEWDRIESDGAGGFEVAAIDDAVGFWTWLETPVHGLRIGLGANRFEASGGVFLAPGVTDEEETLFFSLDADFDRVRVRAEIAERRFTGGNWNPAYLEVDVGVTDRLRIAALYDQAQLLFEIPFFATFDGKIEEIFALGARFYLRSDMVVKLEHQWFEGYGQVEDTPLNIFFDDPVRTNIWIASVSMSF